MNRAEAKALIKSVIESVQELDKHWNSLRSLLGAQVDSHFGHAVFRVTEMNIHYASRLLKDDLDVLSWFIWENQCGAFRLKHSLPCGKMRVIRNIDDLLLVLGYEKEKRNE